jgi:DNA repair protein RadC
MLASWDGGLRRDGVEAALAEAGLALVPDGAEGAFSVEGDTFPHRELIKRQGGRWSGARRRWLFAFDAGGSPRAFAEAEAAAGGLAEDSAGTFQVWGSKHYHGHRERLRTRLREAGATALADYELLELLLFFSVHRRDTKSIAKAMLQHLGGLGGVLGAEPARYAELMGDPPENVGPEFRAARDDDLRFTQVLLKAVHELMQRVLREEVRAREVITSPDAPRAYLQLAMRHEAAEHVRLLFLDRKDRLIRDEVQGRGTVDQATLYPREVVKRALELGASAVVLVHNHPSGDPTPSKADVDSTRQIAAALEQVGIALHDHLIVGGDRLASLRELGVLS